MKPERVRGKAALDGITVLDFTRMLSGPYCTQTLGDFGATVIKIESPDGDDVRRYTPPAAAGEGAYYLSTNRNKQSITLDLKNEQGREIAKKLIAKSDILVENFSNGVMERLGLGYDVAHQLNDKIIYCSISGYGRDDPTPFSRTGYDAMFQAGSGFMSVVGERDRDPMRVPIPVMDLGAGIAAVNAILAALFARPSVGGQHIDIAMFDYAVSLLSFYGMAYLVGGVEAERMGNRAPIITPSDAYPTKDGLVFITCGNDKLFKALVTGLGRSDIAEDPAFASNQTRCLNHAKLREELSKALATNTQSYWVEKLSSQGVPIAPVRSIPQALNCLDVQRRELIENIPHPKAGMVPNIRSPYRLSKTPPVPAAAPPTLGLHTQSVLGEMLGLSANDIQKLETEGCFRARPKIQAG